MSTPLSAPESARRLGLCCWLEQQAFSLLGSWVTEIPEPDAKLTVLEVAEHSAWRAQRWYELLPTAPPGADVLVTGIDALGPFFGAVAGAAGPGRSAEKLVVAEGLLTLIDVVVADLEDRTAPLAGADVRRICGIARRDLATDIARCRGLIEGIEAIGGDITARMDHLRTLLGAASGPEIPSEI